MRLLFIGAGFASSVAARQFAEYGHACLIFDRRSHVAGNCHTERDPGTSVMEHIYGPHIFNTSDDEVWNYVQRFCTMKQFVNRVKASLGRGVFSMPVNLHTINQFFGKRFSPDEARVFIAQQGDQTIGVPKNFEEQALKFLGSDLYEAFFRGYTKKQWGCSPTELPASILQRLPVRFSYDDNYYSTRYQGIPEDGYTALVERILDHPNIEVKLGTDYDPAMRDEFHEVFFTGPIDEFYDHRHGRLGYRTVFWDRQLVDGDYQGNAVINYPGMEVPFTRIHEHKHFAPWEVHQKSIVLTEFSKETEAGDIPYYPKRLAADKELLGKYIDDAREDSGVYFLGRLSTYRYMDMDDVIAESLDFSRRYIAWRANKLLPRPIFANDHEV